MPCRSPENRAARLLVVDLAATLALAGCAAPASAPETSTPETSAPGDDLTGSLTVYAAASLTASFTELLDEFHDEHPDVDVRPASFDGSSTLAAQLAEGAPADVFASADQANMEKVADLVDDPVVFTSNTLEIAVAPGNPKGIRSLADLAKPGMTTVLCAPQVPCGAASQRLLSLDGVTLTPASEEQNVTAVLNKVALGEADAGLVYRTDVAGANGKVDGVAPAKAGEVVNEYPIAVLKGSSNQSVARAFVAFVLSDAGRSILARHGFGAG